MCAIPKYKWSFVKDKLWLFIMILACLYLVSIGFVCLAYPPPNDYACSGCSDTVRDLRTNEIQTSWCSSQSFFNVQTAEAAAARDKCIDKANNNTYYVVDKDANVAAGKSNLCWGFYVKGADEWIESAKIYGATVQPYTSDFDASRDCILTQTPYHLTTSGGYWGYFALIAFMPTIVNAVALGVFILVPQYYFWMIYGLTLPTTLAALVITAVGGSLLAVVYGILLLTVIICLVVTQGESRMNSSLVQQNVCGLAAVDLFDLIGITLGTSALLSFISLAWLAIHLYLNNRLTTVNEVFYFLAVLWVMAYFRNAVTTAGAQVGGSWYYRLNTNRPLWSGFKRAHTMHAGSIALGSILSGIGGLMTVISSYLRTRASAQLIILAVLASLFEFVCRIVNEYAYAFIIFRNQSMAFASVESLVLLEKTAVRLIAPHGYLYALKLCGGIGMGMLGLATAYGVNNAMLNVSDVAKTVTSGLTIYLFLPAVVFGFMTGFIATSVMEGGMRAIYLGFAENQDVLAETDNDLYLDLIDAWEIKLEEYNFNMEEPGVVKEEDSLDDLSMSDFSGSEPDEAELRPLPNKRLKRMRRHISLHPEKQKQPSLSIFAKNSVWTIPTAPRDASDEDEV